MREVNVVGVEIPKRFSALQIQQGSFPATFLEGTISVLSVLLTIPKLSATLVSSAPTSC